MDNEDEQGSEENSSSDADDASTSSKTFTQEDLTRIAAREKDQGKRSGQREVLAALGFESIEDAQAFAKALKDADEAKLSEADKAKKDAASIKAEAERMQAEAKQERYTARVERELSKAGVPEGQVARVSKLLDLDTDAEAEDINTAIAELKQDMPQLFEPGSAQDTKKTPPNSDPGKAPNKKPDQDPGRRARSRLEARHGDKLKSTTSN